MPYDATIDSTYLRNVLSRYPTGVAVIAGLGPNGTPVGLAVGTFTSVSLDPPLVAFLPDKSSLSWPKIRPSGRFCINVLAEEQEDVCRVFATKLPDKFASVTWRPSPSGQPIISGSVAWIDCELADEHDAGDHIIVIGRVTALDVASESRPLLFFRGGYGGFNPRSMATVDSSLAHWFRAADHARPAMELLSQDLDLICTATVLTGGNLTIVASSAGATSGTLDLVGSGRPAIPPVGMSFLAFADPVAVEGWLDRLDAKRDRERIRRLLPEVRARGLAIGLHSPGFPQHDQAPGAPGANDDPGAGARQERMTFDDRTQIRGLHAPVFDANGRVQISINLVLDRARPRTPKYIAAAADALLDAADQVTKSLGGRRPETAGVPRP
jgi:flavin reductase (DIM6/NTAB) family NADH-FMN oxidoreductase RutF/DNA-binding IclR family transcriptional regulator